MKLIPPDGTRYVAPAAARARLRVLDTLRRLYSGWGYEPVEVPALERYDPDHPRAAQSFKLSDLGSGVLALRSDFTPALASLVRLGHHGGGVGGEAVASRFQYAGTVWHAIDPELARTREFTQIGLELIGVSNARADAELIHLARESVRAVGLSPRVEIGNPGVVRALFDLAGVPDPAREALAGAIDRKDASDLRALVADLDAPREPSAALLAMPDFYGDRSSLVEARRAFPWPEVRRELDRLEAVIGEFEDDSELLFDLGMARRLSYYTGVTFRAYTPDFGQALLGGGRYDGALLPFAAGFSLGLERLLSALPEPEPDAPPLLLSLNDEAARRVREGGFSVVRALHADLGGAREEARRRGVPYLLHETLEALVSDPPHRAALQALLEGRG